MVTHKRSGKAVITTAHYRLAKSELRVYASLNPTCGVSKIYFRFLEFRFCFSFSKKFYYKI